MNLFHSTTYADPSRCEDSHHSTDIVIRSEDGKRWTVQACLPGCMPEDEAIGFASPIQAYAYAYESAPYNYAKAFRFAYCGALHRLRGAIDLALADEARFEALMRATDTFDAGSDDIADGLSHVEEQAHAAARAIHSLEASKV